MQDKEIKREVYIEVNKNHLQMLWSILNMKEWLQQVYFNEGTHHSTQSTQITVVQTTARVSILFSQEME